MCACVCVCVYKIAILLQACKHQVEKMCAKSKPADEMYHHGFKFCFGKSKRVTIELDGTPPKGWNVDKRSRSCVVSILLTMQLYILTS